MRLIAILIMTIMCGCTVAREPITGAMITEAEKTCSNLGGVSFVQIYYSNSYTRITTYDIGCKDGATYRRELAYENKRN